MRVALCLSGDMRGQPACLASLTDHVVRPFETAGATVDWLVHTRKDPWWGPAADLPFRMLRVERNVRRIDQFDIVGPQNPLSMGDYADPKAVGSSETRRRPFLYQAYLQYLRSLAGVEELLRRAEAQDGAEYDWVIRARPDIGYGGPLDVSDLVRGEINCPSNDWWMCNGRQCWSDKFAVGPSAAMKLYLTRVRHVRAWCADNILHAEGLMMFGLDRDGVASRQMEILTVVQPPDRYRCALRPDE